MIGASARMETYFDSIRKATAKANAAAALARKKGLDPVDTVEVQTAETLAERVVGLISVLAPQIVGSGVVERIAELEKKYGFGDWRVALAIAEEIAKQTYCKFKTPHEAMDIGIRTGFAYVTVGVVSSPLDGIVSIELKDRMDKRGKYFCVNFAGPIRNAGGTAAAVAVIIADYVRKKMGYDVYDATDDEVKRANTELRDYHDRVTNLQYFPSEAEVQFLLKKLPLEVSGDPSERIEVSNFKNLPRIPTNQIRSGYCLILSSCIPLKAPKLWKQIQKWGKEFDLDQWMFLEEFLAIQKKEKAKGAGAAKKEGGAKISPDFTYIADLVAGRPVLGHPLAHGGFRLRYGRGRVSGYSGQSIHPATMALLNEYIAIGTQLKVERPGKAASMTAISTIDGPVVKLVDGSVHYIKSVKEAREVKDRVKELLYLGDVLIAYGDFANRNHPLVPAGYCQEWWAQELEKATVNLFGSLDFQKLAELVEIPSRQLETIVRNPLTTQVSASTALTLAEKAKIPLHPSFTYYWGGLTYDSFVGLVHWLRDAKITQDDDGRPCKIVLPKNDAPKRSLEILAVPHSVIGNEFVVIDGDAAQAFLASLGFPSRTLKETHEMLLRAPGVAPLDFLNSAGPLTIRDKGGTFIGARMGRPEKAKMRELTGSPHTLFPVGDEGGRLRSFQAALEKGKVESDFPVYFCASCKTNTIFRVCERCEKRTLRVKMCPQCGESANCPHPDSPGVAKPQQIDIRHHFTRILASLGMNTYPDLIKGVRGTSNKEHTPEHLAKGILRAKHDIAVNKDGTTRYDMTELPITHFKPKEVGTGVHRLRELGYTADIKGQPLTDDGQVLELMPQDVILPACDDSPDEGADRVLVRVAQFIDDLLSSFYKEQPFYRVNSAEDLIGHLVVCLAPHTSAGMVGRIIGFSKTQGFLAHPYIHAATRRDCDGDESCVLLLMDALLNFSKKYLPSSRGSTMDAPLVLTSILTPTEVDDMAFDVDISWQYPLQLYEAALRYASPAEVQIPQIKATLNTPAQFEGMGFTHDTEDLNDGIRVSAYKTLPSMEEKLKGQMDLAERIRAVKTAEVARLVIEKHFIKDLKGNLRKFSEQEFRCVGCNEKYRRPPLVGRCTKCANGKLIFTISQGSIVKYLEPTVSLAKKYNLSAYLQQSIMLLQRRIEGVFGREKEKQTGLGAWFG